MPPLCIKSFRKRVGFIDWFSLGRVRYCSLAVSRPMSCEVSSAKYADIKYSLKGSTESPKAFISLSERLEREKEREREQRHFRTAESRSPGNELPPRPVGKISVVPCAAVFSCQRVNSHLYPRHWPRDIIGEGKRYFSNLS